MKERKPGTVREGRIPIYDHEGHMRGHVGPHATSATVARFVGRHGSTLGKRDGRHAWIGPPPPPKPKPKPIPKPVAAQEPSLAKSSGQHTLEISLRAAKGSVNKDAGKK
jgi:hypothetical protein